MRWLDKVLVYLDDADSGSARARACGQHTSGGSRLRPEPFGGRAARRPHSGGLRRTCWLAAGSNTRQAARSRAFEIVLVVLSITEVWEYELEGLKLGGVFSWPLPVFVTLCGGAACLPAWRRLGFFSLAMGMAVAVWNAFPATGNHVYLECFLCLICALLDPVRSAEQQLLTRSVRWIGCVIMFFAGVQKLVHGYYTNGLMPSYLFQEPRFGRIFGWLLPASEAQRLHSYNGLDGSGPYLVSAPALLLASNAVWIFEIALAVALFVASTRRAAVFAGIVFVVLVESGAREIMFGVLFVSVLLMFLSTDANRFFVPIAAVVCVIVLLTQLGWLPVELH